MTDEANVAALRGALLGGIEMIGALQSAVGVARDRGDAARAQVAATIDGSSHTEALEALNHLQVADGLLEEVIGESLVAVDRLTSYLGAL